MRNGSVNALLGGAAFFALTSAFVAQAAPIAFTDRSAFDVAVAGLANVSPATLDFDSLMPGSVIASGDTLGGITFTYNFGGVSLNVNNVYPTTSSPNFLGTDDADVLQDGDDITLSFSARNAVGLYLMSIDPLIDDDFRLTVGAASVSLLIADLQDTLSDDTSVYFLGIVDPTSTFGAASVTTSHDGGAGYFLWNADDIVTTTVAQVPEPETWIMLLAGLGLLGMKDTLWVRRRKVARPWG